jgi:hypothetical protein
MFFFQPLNNEYQPLNIANDKTYLLKLICDPRREIFSPNIRIPVSKGFD